MGDLATGDDDPEVECFVVVVVIVVIVILSVLLPVVELVLLGFVEAETFIMVVIEIRELVAAAV